MQPENILVSLLSALKPRDVTPDLEVRHHRTGWLSLALEQVFLKQGHLLPAWGLGMDTRTWECD